MKYAIQVLSSKKIEINLIDHMIKLFQTGWEKVTEKLVDISGEILDSVRFKILINFF